MRIVAGLMIFLLGVGQAHAAAPAPILLSYGELMRLTPGARIAYLREMGELLGLMEEQFERKLETAANQDVNRLREQVALLMRLTLPEAAADLVEGVDLAGVKPQWNGTEYTCGDGKSVKFVPRLVTCAAVPTGRVDDPNDPTSISWNECPRGTHAAQLRTFGGWVPMGAYNCIPDASWALLNDKVKKKLDKGGTFGDYAKMTPAEKSAHVGVPNGGEPGAVPAVTDADGKPLATAKVKCEPLKGQAYKDAVLNFRRSGAEKCIAGGFFTDKKPNVLNKASCEKRYVYPKEKVAGFQFKCPANQVLCNPAVFCLAVKDVKYMDGGQEKKSDMLDIVCVKDSPFLTRECNKKFLSKLGKPPANKRSGYEDANTKKNEACDPATVNIPFLKGQFMDEYLKLKADTEKMFYKHCTGNDSDFLPLFCEECRIVEERLAKMRKPSAAAPADQPQPPAGTAPANSGR